MTSLSTSVLLKPIRLAIFVVLTGLLCACASTGKQDLPAVTEDGLTLVPDTAAYAVYRSPDADLGHYNRVYIADIEVAFKDDWVKDQNRDTRRASHRVTQQDADRIKAAVSEAFGEILTEELEEGGYQVVEQVAQAESTDDLLLLRPAIVNLDVSAPDTPDPLGLPSSILTA